MSYDILVLAPKGQTLEGEERIALVGEVRRLKGAKGNQITGYGVKAKNLLVSIEVQCEDDPVDGPANSLNKASAITRKVPFVLLGECRFSVLR